MINCISFSWQTHSGRCGTVHSNIGLLNAFQWHLCSISGWLWSSRRSRGDAECVLCYFINARRSWSRKKSAVWRSGLWMSSCRASALEFIAHSKINNQERAWRRRSQSVFACQKINEHKTVHNPHLVNNRFLSTDFIVWFFRIRRERMCCISSSFTSYSQIMIYFIFIFSD